MANILVLGVKVPFSFGGQEVLVKALVSQLQERRHCVDLVELPFSAPRRESLIKEAALWRSIDLENFPGHKVDLVIATKFPSYYARHPRKSVWLVHQHRPIYDLYGSGFSDFTDDPRDEALRLALQKGDEHVLAEAAYVSGISGNVVKRLEVFNNLKADILYPPLPLGDSYRCEDPQDYILSVGRLCRIKRIDLMIKAMPMVPLSIKLKIVGTQTEPGVMDYFKAEIDKHHLWDRVEFLGRVSDEDLISLYSKAMAVYYAPHDEDYGYVTLEAMASGRPVITACDSGGVLEFVEHNVNGVIANPDSDSLANAVNSLVSDRQRAIKMGQAGLALVAERGLTDANWNNIVDKLLSPLNLPGNRSDPRQVGVSLV